MDYLVRLLQSFFRCFVRYFLLGLLFVQAHLLISFC